MNAVDGVSFPTAKQSTRFIVEPNAVLVVIASSLAQDSEILMRPFEILLLLVNFMALLLMYRSSSLKVYNFRVLPIVAALASIVQLLIEGPRWQMVPAYLMIALLFPNWLSRKITVLLGGSALAVSFILSTAIPVFHFAKPTGPYEIGTFIYHWVDESRLEAFDANAKKYRELIVQIWYPAQHDATLQQASYLPDADAFSAAQGKLHNWPSFLLGHLKYVKTNAQLSAKVAADKPKFPVLIFLEGITGYRQMNNFQVEELVSHGYVVVAIDQPFVAASVVFPDGRVIAGLSKIQMNPLLQQSIAPVQPAPLLNGITNRDGIIPYFAQDAVFTLDQLEKLNNTDPNTILGGRLDLQRVGIFGVSFGGIIVGEACRVDRRLRACLVMDAPMTARVVRESLSQPSMWITRDAQTMRNEGWSTFDIDQHQSTMWAVFNGVSGDGYFVQVSGMFHVNLTDVPYFSPLLGWNSVFGPLVTGPIDGKRAHDIVNAYSVAFFDKYLNGPPSNFLDGFAKQFPEVQFEKR
jgi:Platelet-activating factor acetylhydrolase, isoform II